MRRYSGGRRWGAKVALPILVIAMFQPIMSVSVLGQNIEEPTSTFTLMRMLTNPDLPEDHSLNQGKLQLYWKLQLYSILIVGAALSAIAIFLLRIFGFIHYRNSNIGGGLCFAYAFLNFLFIDELNYLLTSEYGSLATSVVHLNVGWSAYIAILAGALFFIVDAMR